MKAMLLSLSLLGCGVQATGGLSHTARDGYAAAGTVTVTTQATRQSNAVLGLRSSGLVEDGYFFRNVALHAGYDFLLAPGWFALELGPELAAGKPLGHVYSGVGAYLGAASTARLRLSRGADREATYNILYPMFELVLTPRIGAWGPPEGAPDPNPLLEWGAELGVRYAFGSDVVSPRLGEIQDGEKPEKAAPGRMP